jgi:hypothetical protein
MRVLILLAILLLFIPYNVYADDNITVSMTTTVVPYYGGGGGGGGGWTYNDPVPYTPVDWTKLFPSMLQTKSSPPVDNRPVQNNPTEFVPPVVGNPPQSLPTFITDIVGTENQDIIIIAMILLGAILIGLILYLIIPEQRVR